MADLPITITISRRDRRLFEWGLVGAFFLIAVVPIVLGLGWGTLTHRVVDMQGPITTSGTLLGALAGWLKTLGHRENLKGMKEGDG